MTRKIFGYKRHNKWTKFKEALVGLLITLFTFAFMYCLVAEEIAIRSGERGPVYYVR